MQTLIDKFGTNATYLIAFAVAIVFLLLLVFLARALFGARIRTGGGRSRQPRLGVVDAFDLDRQRQLVLVRRDHVEHLVMIGGPNDLLIESTIIRAPGVADVRPRVQPSFDEVPAAPAPGGRTAATPASPPSIDDLVQAVTPPPAPTPVPARAVPVPPPPVARVEPAPPPPPPAAAPLQTPPMRPVAKADVPVPPPPPSPPSPVVPPPPPPPMQAVPPPPPPPPPAVMPDVRPAVQPVPVPPPPPPANAETARKRFDFGRLMSSRQPESLKPAAEAPAAQSAPEVTTMDAPAPLPAAPDAPAAPAGKPAAGSIDALEQEMAKLLGRPQGGP